MDPIGPVVSKGKIHPHFSIFSNSGHVGWKSGSPDTILKGIIQGLLEQSLVPTGPVASVMKIFKIASPFFIFSNSDHVGWRSIPPKFGLKWPSGFRGEHFLVIVDGRTMDAK